MLLYLGGFSDHDPYGDNHDPDDLRDVLLVVAFVFLSILAMLLAASPTFAQIQTIPPGTYHHRVPLELRGDPCYEQMRTAYAYSFPHPQSGTPRPNKTMGTHGYEYEHKRSWRTLWLRRRMEVPRLKPLDYVWADSMLMAPRTFADVSLDTTHAVLRQGRLWDVVKDYCEPY